MIATPNVAKAILEAFELFMLLGNEGSINPLVNERVVAWMLSPIVEGTLEEYRQHVLSEKLKARAVEGDERRSATLDSTPVSEDVVTVSALTFYREEFCPPERVRAAGIDPEGQQLIAEHRRVAFAILQRLVGGDEQLCPERVAARPRLGPCVESISNVGHCTWCKRKLR